MPDDRTNLPATRAAPAGAWQTFHDLLEAIDAGSLTVEATEAMNEVIETMLQRKLLGMSGKASIVLNIDFRLDKGAVDLVGHVKYKVPAPPRTRTVAWLTESGHLMGSDPRQAEMFGRPVPEAPRQPGRTIDVEQPQPGQLRAVT